ncbi:MAG TPA: hypothetical protein VES65_08805 [Solirubrobacteraceae bacterium]|nr:hypothetical protein [Solirubrobacteraceae bacterium]
MSQDEPSGPDLAGVVADATAVGLEHVVIGGFSVIFHGYVRATKDSDLLVPDGPDADAAVLRFLERVDARRLRDGKVLTNEDVAGGEHLRVVGRRGIVDIMRGGFPPLDYDTVSRDADTIEWNGQTVRVASLPSVVGFKRLAGRPRDRVDLAELEAIYDELPIEPIPGVDE